MVSTFSFPNDGFLLSSLIELDHRHQQTALSESEKEKTYTLFEQFLQALELGHLRCAFKDENTWKVDPKIKQIILFGFRLGHVVPMEGGFLDKHTYPKQRFELNSRVRIVPGGTSIRRGAHLGKGCVVMPPAYINVGTFVGEDSMIDSHALIGSCAQVGKRVHLSACAQLGGVLEPVNNLPVIIEDDVFIGGNCGVYEGTLVREGAVLAAGVVLTGSSQVYDCVHQKMLQATLEKPLEIPKNAVVVPGSRPMRNGFGKEHGLHIATPVIIKYRDPKTNSKTALEEALR